jgi:hypothetical protein
LGRPALRAALIAPAGALLAWLMIDTGFANYDTAYSILWGADLAEGRTPDYSVPIAPTPHPLSTALGLALSPLGDGAETAWVVLAFLSLGALAWVVFELGLVWFGAAAGALAALIVITREPVLSFGVRAYVDIPYVALVLGALLAEALKPRRGVLPLALLTVAGLLRPEAWLFAGVYWLWLGRPWRLVWLVAIAPVLWLAFDWAIAGDPLHSLLGTRETAQELNRRTGLDELPITVPRRIGEILREPVLLGAAIGGVLALWKLRPRALPGAAAGVVALAAFSVLAAAGLPILGRYLLLPAAILAVFCGAGVFGWRLLARDDPWRQRWIAGAALTAVALLAFTPKQADRIASLNDTIGIQREIRDDLHEIADRIECGPVFVVNHRPVPLLALWTDRPPGEIRAKGPAQGRGSVVLPRSDEVARQYVLDPRDPVQDTPVFLHDFDTAAANDSWELLARC